MGMPMLAALRRAYPDAHLTWVAEHSPVQAIAANPHVEESAARTFSQIGTVAGILTFRQSAALIARSALVVSGDTGPMHMAAALGTPQIALFGPTSPAWYDPHAHPARCSRASLN